MTGIFRVGTTLIFAALFSATAHAAEISSTRVDALGKMLDSQARGFGRTINDRPGWERLGELSQFQAVVRSAERLISQPIPEQSDDLYLDFSKTGNRTRWQRVASRRRGRIDDLVIAECVENKGRFLDAFRQIVGAVYSERTWVMPAHDTSLANFHGKTVDIDLGSATLAWSLASADYLLADKLKPATRKLLRENLSKRIFTPYQDMVNGKRKKNWWMTTTNNWNAVCLAGVTGSALAVLDSTQQRAFYIAAAEHYSKNFLRGFTPDGYCSEGLGYWNYGFGYYAMLCEMIYQATDGDVDLFDNDRARQAALFGAKIEIINGVYPAFADCSVDAGPSSLLMYYVSRRLGLGLKQWEDIDTNISGGSLYRAMMYTFDNSASQAEQSQTASALPGIRTWFDDAGVLICRPGSSDSKLAVALKGGHNSEHHNHNDVGSYVVVLGDKLLLADPGAEVYTARTFSGRRYQSNVLNSFGHPVPVVAGTLQKTGSSAAAEILSIETSDASDSLVLDITSAYPVAELKKLLRSFEYNRTGTGGLKITDEVVLSKPRSFSTAVITFEEWKRLGTDRLVIGAGNEAIEIVIDTNGAAFDIKAEQIKEDLKHDKLPTRLAIELADPVKRAAVNLTIRPISAR